MHSVATNRPAGKIDLVIGRHPQDGDLRWYGLEIQAVYFSGTGMSSQFEVLQGDASEAPPYPDRIRRPDWRSSSAKRLMPQLQVKVPTVRRWQAKMAVAVDQPFFEAIGGPSANYTQDLNDGDIIWLIPELVLDDATNHYRLQRGHWEVLNPGGLHRETLGSGYDLTRGLRDSLDQQTHTDGAYRLGISSRSNWLALVC